MSAVTAGSNTCGNTVPAWPVPVEAVTARSNTCGNTVHALPVPELAAYHLHLKERCLATPWNASCGASGLCSNLLHLKERWLGKWRGNKARQTRRQELVLVDLAASHFPARARIGGPGGLSFHGISFIRQPLAKANAPWRLQAPSVTLSRACSLVGASGLLKPFFQFVVCSTCSSHVLSMSSLWSAQAICLTQ